MSEENQPPNLAAGLSDLSARLRQLRLWLEDCERCRASHNDAGVAAALNDLHRDSWAFTATSCYWAGVMGGKPGVLKP